MSELRFSLFGRFRVQRGDCELAGFEARKVQELTSYLLLNRSRTHTREALADLFWESNTTTQAKKNLRQVLWQVQSALEHADDGDDGPLLHAETDWIQVNPNATYWLDVGQFEDAFVRVQDIPGTRFTIQAATELQEAIQLYQGDLLEGWYHDWCLFERERLQSMCLVALEKLVNYCEARHDYERGMAYAARILRCDGARERTHRCLMRLYYLSGDRTGALRQFDRCARALADELEVEPSRRTLALYEQIKTDRVKPVLPATATIGGLGLAEPGDALADTLSTLQRIQGTLTELQRQLMVDIQTVEDAIRRQPS